MTPRISAVAPAPRSQLDVTWDNGRTDRIDLKAHLARFAVLAPLNDASIFAHAKVGEWAWDVTWGGDLEIAASTLLRLAREQAGAAMPNADFRAWMERNRLSLTDAAEALGLSRRTVTYYSSGARAIPRYIALACKGWEAEQRRAA
ncbi:MAG: DUF2442 domain-containing protein [Panacagrimonas sp.]